MRCMNDRMTQAAIGSIGETAIQKVAAAYLDYMIEHPGVYETIQWISWHGTEETSSIFHNYILLLSTLFAPAHLKKKTQQIF